MPTRPMSPAAAQLRRHVIRMLQHAGSGHTAGALGLCDFFACLYQGGIMRYRPQQPQWPGRDIFMLSNGHVVPALYAAMAQAGFFPVTELFTLRQYGSRLQGHPERTVLPGLESTSGPLGCGLSQAAGYAYSLQYMDNDSHRFVYVLTGDGELDEGNIWEAAMFAGGYHLRQLIAYVDRNNIQIDGTTDQVMPLEDLLAKWRSFGWHAQEVDGHNEAEIMAATRRAQAVTNQPSVIILRTIPGMGVDFMEYDYRWHGKAPNQQQALAALAQLTQSAVVEDSNAAG